VQFYDEIRIFNLKICRWIIERKMSVLPDAEKCNINVSRCNLFPHAPHDLRRIGSISVEQVIFLDSSLLNELLQKHLPKTPRMRSRKPDVFIKMKSLDLGPIDALRFRQRIQKV